MRALSKWGLTIGLLVVSVGAVRSEEREKIIPAEGAVQLMLLRQHTVQDELKLTKDQILKVDDFASKQWKTAQEIHKLDPDKAKPKFEELGKANEKFIAETLKPE